MCPIFPFPLVSVPGAPVNLRAVPRSHTEIHISWDAPLDSVGAVTSYRMYYYEVGANGEEEIDTGQQSQFTMTELHSFREYSFRVVAYNENGAGVSTEEVMAKTFSAGESSVYRYWKY